MLGYLSLIYSAIRTLDCVLFRLFQKVGDSRTNDVDDKKIFFFSPRQRRAQPTPWSVMPHHEAYRRVDKKGERNDIVTHSLCALMCQIGILCIKLLLIVGHNSWFLMLWSWYFFLFPLPSFVRFFVVVIFFFFLFYWFSLCLAWLCGFCAVALCFVVNGIVIDDRSIPPASGILGIRVFFYF